jgi:2,4-dienoyl-CoA reductase (NADPH2)
MGSMHTGLEDRAASYPKLAAYLAERAAGGAGLIVTGGIAPNIAGWVAPFAGKLSARREVPRHRLVTDAVHAAGGRVCMQILHAGRYAYHPLAVAPSPLKSPISPFKPRGLSARGVEAPDRRVCPLRGAGARGRLRRRGDDGLRGLPHQPVHRRAHQPARRRLGRQLREPHAASRWRSCGASARRWAGLHHHLPPVRMLDLVEGGSTGTRWCSWPRRRGRRRDDLVNTGIGWHEARIPTIATRCRARPSPG